MTDPVVRLPGDMGSRGVGPAPEYFEPDARRAWDDIVLAVLPGTLKELDKYMLETTAYVLAQVLRGSGGDEVEHARLKVSVRQSLKALEVPANAIDALLAGGRSEESTRGA